MARKNSPNHGSLNQVRERYYYKATLPGTDKRKTYPLVPPGHTKSTREKRMAITLANELWDRAESVAQQGGNLESLSAEMTLKDYTDRYMQMKQYELAATTLENYDVSIRYALAFFGPDRRLYTLTPAMVQEFKTALLSGGLKEAMKLKKEMNRVSVNIHMKQMRSVINFAVTKLKILPVNPFSGMVDTIKQSKRWHYVTQDELQETLDAATENYRCLIALCRLAALRRFEAYNLQWQDVNFEKGTIFIVGNSDWQPKDRQSRTVPMCPELQQILLDAFDRTPEKQSRICPLDYGGNIGRDVIATIKRAGLTPWAKPLHTLRKSCITDWASRYPIHAVKEWAGHEDIATTQQYYLQVPPDTYRQAAAASFWAKPPMPSMVDAEEKEPVEA